MTDQELALIKAIIINPGDDTHRKVYADYLDETAGTVPCPRCYEQLRAAGLANHCVCKGNGWLPGPRAARAEFIRVQCELARIPDPPPEPSVGMRVASREQRLRALMEWKKKWVVAYYTLRRREGELYAVACESFLTINNSQVRLDSQKSGGWDVEMVIRRGFVEVVTCSWEAWDGGWAVTRHRNYESDDYSTSQSRLPGIAAALHWWHGATDRCPTCDGEGVLNYYQRPDSGCPACGGSGTVPRPCPPTAQPVREVVLTTWPELHIQPQDGYWYSVELADEVGTGLVAAETWPGPSDEMPAMTRRRIVAELLAGAYPGITFTLPSASSAGGPVPPSPG